MTQLLKDIATNNKIDSIMYDTSKITTLSKEYIGGNALTVIFFCLQHGDHKGSTVTLSVLKNCDNIVGYPIINDGKTLAVLKRYR
jgi:hypothetical protein